jgi:hypothetical protein
MHLMPRRPGTVVEIHRPRQRDADATTERGVIIHAALKWFVAYFPGSSQCLASPADSSSIRVVATTDLADAIVAFRDLPSCDPRWVLDTWEQLSETGPGELQAPEVIRVWELAAALAHHRLDAEAASLITREQLECWAGRALTDVDLSELDEAIPNSAIPDAIGEIVASMDSRDLE